MELDNRGISTKMETDEQEAHPLDAARHDICYVCIEKSLP